MAMKPNEIGPATYLTPQGEIAVDIIEALQVLGWPDTEENRQIAANAVKLMMAEKNPQLKTKELSINPRELVDRRKHGEP